MSTELVSLASLETLKTIAEHIRDAWEAGRSWRLSLLFSSIDQQLREEKGLDAKTLQTLVVGSHQESFRETIYQTATKAILAESNLAIRVMAVIAAKHIADRATITYDDLLLLRGLQTLTDDEVILGIRIWQLYSEGKIPLDPVEPKDNEAHANYKKKHISPSKNVTDAIGVTDYIPKVEALKRANALGDSPHGYMGQSGGWGHVTIIPRSEMFAKYGRIAQGLPSQAE